jgi:beta-RFAP synthase
VTRVVEVRTGARLHIGLLSTGHRGRLGGIGMMIDRPGVALRACIADQDRIDADDEARQRIAAFLSRIREGLHSIEPEGRRDEFSRRSYSIEVSGLIPAHCGFGSGTQLAFAVSAAVGGLLGFKVPVTHTFLGRGERSTVGSIGFQRGGFIADPGEIDTAWPGGVVDQCHPGVQKRLAVAHSLPGSWRTVIILPPSQGPSGTLESEAFKTLAPMPRETTDRLVRLVSYAILPSLKSGLLGGSGSMRFTRFASAAAEFNRLVGEHFAPAQGGVYAHPLIRDLARMLADTDWPYLAQSSWGPAAAVFCQSQESAEALRTFLGRQITPDDAHVFIASPKNTGAKMTFTEA